MKKHFVQFLSSVVVVLFAYLYKLIHTFMAICDSTKLVDWLEISVLYFFWDMIKKDFVWNFLYKKYNIRALFNMHNSNLLIYSLKVFGTLLLFGYGIGVSIKLYLNFWCIPWHLSGWGIDNFRSTAYFVKF